MPVVQHEAVDTFCEINFNETHLSINFHMSDVRVIGIKHLTQESVTKKKNKFF